MWVYFVFLLCGLEPPASLYLFAVLELIHGCWLYHKWWQSSEVFWRVFFVQALWWKRSARRRSWVLFIPNVEETSCVFPLFPKKYFICCTSWLSFAAFSSPTSGYQNFALQFLTCNLRKRRQMITKIVVFCDQSFKLCSASLDVILLSP